MAIIRYFCEKSMEENRLVRYARDIIVNTY